MRRLAWLTALALVASCGSDPPKPETPVTVHRKKKKKKKKPVEVAEAKDEGAADAESKEDKRKKQEEEDAKEAEERRERQRKREEEESAKEAEEQAVSSDQGGDSSESGDDSEKKSDDEDEKAEEKKRKKEEAAEKKKEAAEEKKRKREEAAEKKKEAAEEKKRKKEEAAEEARAKKEAAAEAKKKKNKHSEDVEEASSDDESAAKSSDDESSSDEDEPKKEDKKAKKGKAKKVVAAKDKKSGKKKKKDDEDEAKDEDKEEKADDEKSDKAEKEVAKAEEPEEDTSSSLPPPDPENESKELDLEGGAVPTRDTGEDAPKVTAILAIDRRPLTNAKGKLDVHGGLRVAAVQVPSMGLMGKTIYNTATSEGFGLGGTYGVSDKIQVGLDYTIGLHPGSAKGPFSLSAAFRVKESEKLDIAISAGFALDFQTKTDQTMSPPVTTTETIKGLQFGIWARYHLAPKFSAFTGLPATPSSAAGVPPGAGLPPLPYHLSVGLGSKAAIAMELPFGVAYQASPKLYTFAMTSLGHLGMNNSTSAFIFADYIPFSVGGFYANDTKLDFGAVISDDVKQGTGFLRFDLVARYYLK